MFGAGEKKGWFPENAERLSPGGDVADWFRKTSEKEKKGWGTISRVTALCIGVQQPRWFKSRKGLRGLSHALRVVNDFAGVFRPMELCAVVICTSLEQHPEEACLLPLHELSSFRGEGVVGMESDVCFPTAHGFSFSVSASEKDYPGKAFRSGCSPAYKHKTRHEAGRAARRVSFRKQAE